MRCRYLRRRTPPHSASCVKYYVGKKEEFRKYLEQTGVIDQLTKVLVGLYEEPEKPQDAVEFIKKYLGQSHDLDVNKL